MRRTLILSSCLLVLPSATVLAQSSSQPGAPPPATVDAARPLIEPFLFKGDLAGARAAVEKALAADKEDDALRFQLGTVEFLGGVEELFQSLYTYGLRDYSTMVPFLRCPAGQNPRPKQISYKDSRRILQTWLDHLNKTNEILEPMRNPQVKMPLHFGLIGMDFDGDGKSTGSETLWRVFAEYNNVSFAREDIENFVICFDLADSVWLRGYCNLLAAMCEILLAHDYHEAFERAGHVFFAKIKTPHDCLNNGLYVFDSGMGVDFLDIIAFVHLINFPVVEIDRMEKARGHLRSMVQLSRKTWELIDNEIDNDNEWLPSPTGQASVIGTSVTKEQVKAWHMFLDNLDDVLTGKKLLPHPRLPKDRGVNLLKVFKSDRNFDLILWIQGTDLTPFVEKGPVVGGETWSQLERIFQGRFTYYALWFN